MIIYFSGTGNSRYCAQLLADKLGDKAINAAEYIKSGRSADLSSDKPWVFVSPVYGWRIPHVFADFIRRSRFSGNINAYFVITCGSDIGNAAKYLIPICEEKCLSFCGALEAVMPENYLAMFPVPDEEKSAKIISAVHPLLENAASFIASSKPFEKRSYRIGDNIKSSVVNKYFCRYFIKASPFYSKDSCVGLKTAGPLGEITVPTVWHASVTALSRLSNTAGAA